jgi:hypothetical protein
MNTDEYPELPKSLEKYIQSPYGGLFGDSVITHVVHKIVADPNRQFTPKYLEKITGRTQPAIKPALDTLVDLKLLHKEQIDPQRPIYEVNLASNQLMALTFLAYATIDDREGSHCMKDAVFEYCEYCKFELKANAKYEPVISLENMLCKTQPSEFPDLNTGSSLNTVCTLSQAAAGRSGY